MKTKSVPCIVMLVAGLASCLISISQQVDTMEFTERLLSTLVIFYILGFIIKLILDKAMKNLSSAKEDENEKDISAASAKRQPFGYSPSGSPPAICRSATAPPAFAA